MSEDPIAIQLSEALARIDRDAIISAGGQLQPVINNDIAHVMRIAAKLVGINDSLESENAALRRLCARAIAKLEDHPFSHSINDVIRMLTPAAEGELVR